MFHIYSFKWRIIFRVLYAHECILLRVQLWDEFPRRISFENMKQNLELFNFSKLFLQSSADFLHCLIYLLYGSVPRAYWANFIYSLCPFPRREICCGETRAREGILFKFVNFGESCDVYFKYTIKRSRWREFLPSRYYAEINRYIDISLVIPFPNVTNTRESTLIEEWYVCGDFPAKVSIFRIRAWGGGHHKRLETVHFVINIINTSILSQLL